jgi:hypothetical protein
MKTKTREKAFSIQLCTLHTKIQSIHQKEHKVFPSEKAIGECGAGK